MTAGVVSTRARLGDLLAKAALAAMYTIFATAHLEQLRDGFRFSLALAVAFESIMVGLVVFRRAAETVDRRPLVVVVVGLLGSFAVLGFRPVATDAEPLIGQILLTAGFVLQVVSSLSLGRSFGLLPANRGIKTEGMYRFVRHPLYLSYLLAQTGYVITNPSWRNATIVVAATAMQVGRIHYEERLLDDWADYVEYRSLVRHRLVPFVW